jgi:hypothetical protein
MASDPDFGEFDIGGLKVAEPVDDIVDVSEHVKSEAIVEPESIKKVCAIGPLRYMMIGLGLKVTAP